MGPGCFCRLFPSQDDSYVAIPAEPAEVIFAQRLKGLATGHQWGSLLDNQGVLIEVQPVLSRALSFARRTPAALARPQYFRFPFRP